jgi:hypothetical protein
MLPSSTDTPGRPAPADLVFNAEQLDHDTCLCTFVFSEACIALSLVCRISQNRIGLILCNTEELAISGGQDMSMLRMLTKDSDSVKRCVFGALRR